MAHTPRIGSLARTGTWGNRPPRQNLKDSASLFDLHAIIPLKVRFPTNGSSGKEARAAIKWNSLMLPPGMVIE